MKKIFLFITLIICTLGSTSCEPNEDDGDSSSPTQECGTHNGNTLYLGPQGGCYYYNSNGNKTYVDRSECHC